MSGWIKIHRSILSHWIYQDPITYWWWTDMLFLASYKDAKVRVKRQLVDVKRGQFVASIAFLKERWRTNKDKVIDFLKLLESDGMIDKSSDKNITLITICNYESYQDVSDNLSDNLSDNISDSVPTEFRQSSEQIKEIKEVQEYIYNSNACTREERVSWNPSVEQGYLERFKAQGSAKLMMRATGKTLAETMQLLDVYMATRQMQDIGHKDFSHFCEAFKQAILKDKIKIPTAPTPQPRVVSGQAIFDLIK